MFEKATLQGQPYTPTQWFVIVLSPINDACFFVCLLLFFGGFCLFLLCFFYNVTLAYGHVYIDSRRS